MTDRERSRHEAGVRAALSVVRPPTPEGAAMRELREIAATFTATAADVARVGRAIRCRHLAREVRALERKVEAEVNLDASKLRAFAIYLENRADVLDGTPL